MGLKSITFQNAPLFHLKDPMQISKEVFGETFLEGNIEGGNIWQKQAYQCRQGDEELVEGVEHLGLG